MDKLKAMQTFVRIVEANSFTKAAETLNLPRASLTATLKNLEAFLGTQLIQRTTRRLSLTPDGAEYYRHSLDILAAVDAAELAFRGPAAARPRGTLRVGMPSTLGRSVVMPRIGEFHAAYPEVGLTITLSERVTDLTQEGLDCALRVGQLQDSSLVGRQIGLMRFVTCAAPAYLATAGTPQTIEDLRMHRSVVHFSGRTGRPFDWDLMVGDEVRRVDIGGPVAVNDADANLLCARQGLGLAQAAMYQVRDYLARGELQLVLPATPPTPMPISLLYPRGQLGVPKLKVFAQWVSTVFEEDADLRL